MQYFLIVLAALGGFATAWPIAYAWSVKLALSLAQKIIDREFNSLEDAQRALAELHKLHIDRTDKRRQT